VLWTLNSLNCYFCAALIAVTFIIVIGYLSSSHCTVIISNLFNCSSSAIQRNTIVSWVTWQSICAYILRPRRGSGSSFRGGSTTQAGRQQSATVDGAGSAASSVSQPPRFSRRNAEQQSSDASESMVTSTATSNVTNGPLSGVCVNQSVSASVRFVEQSMTVRWLFLVMFEFVICSVYMNTIATSILWLPNDNKLLYSWIGIISSIFIGIVHLSAFPVLWVAVVSYFLGVVLRIFSLTSLWHKGVWPDLSF